MAEQLRLHEAASAMQRLLNAFNDDYSASATPRELYETEMKESVALLMVLFGAAWAAIVPIVRNQRERHANVRRQPDCLRFLLGYKRSFEKFSSGHASEAPPRPYMNFQFQYAGDRVHLYLQVFRSVLFRGHVMVVVNGATAALLSWWLRNAEAIYERGHSRLGPAEPLRTNFEAIARVHQVVLPLASVFLSLYVLFRVSRVYRAMDVAWRLQGRIHDLAILLGALLAPYRGEPGVREVLWTIQRHLNLIHFLAYSEASKDVKFASMDDDKLIESGLLFGDESEHWSSDQDARISGVFSWLLASLDRLVEVQLIGQAFAPVVIESASDLMAACHALAEEGREARRPSLAAAHIVQILADWVTVMSPFAVVHLFREQSSGPGTYFWTMAGSMFIALFYQAVGWLGKVMQNPFDDETDGLNPTWAMMTTERRVFACLAGGDGAEGSEEDWAVTPAGLTMLARKAAGAERMPPPPAVPKTPASVKPATKVEEIYHPTCMQNHPCKIFITEEDGWTCDICAAEFGEGSHLFGCFECDWDCCQDCAEDQQAVKQEQALAVPAPAPAPAPKPAPKPLPIKDTPAPVVEPPSYAAPTQELMGRMEMEDEFEVPDEVAPDESSVRDENFVRVVPAANALPVSQSFDMGSELGSVMESEGGSMAGRRAKKASEQYEFGQPRAATSSALNGAQPNGVGVVPYGSYEAVPYQPAPGVVTLNRELVQATFMALKEPREIILDDESLARLETVTTRPIAELASALIDVQSGVNPAKVFAGPLPAVAEEDDVSEGYGPREGPVMENGSLRAPGGVPEPTPPGPAGNEQATQGERVILDLIGQFHSELQSASDLRSQAAAIQAGVATGVGRMPPPSQVQQQALPAPSDDSRGVEPPSPGGTSRGARSRPPRDAPVMTTRDSLTGDVDEISV